ncbi:hypothetical protein BpHYR1_024020 [Brachionus plicatilis]|uniref:Uncharacterized protein n=1 Tax=Brachionus plicatilis TaxID=10195 RepID=A0A3M7SIY1_BRAPC|nr:hypothetical protein BpHYR1_024020 [Brachionus plicatilis]
MNFANGKKICLNDLKKFCHNQPEYSSIDVLINGKARYLVNVPADGWCLLYSFIASYNAGPGPKVSISDLCMAILRQFQLKCQTKSLPYEFLSLDEDCESLITSQNESIEEIFKFFLIRYLKDKYFETFVLDYLPQLIADYFECNITIQTFTSGALNLFNEFKSEGGNQRNVEILFCPDLSHFMALSVSDKISQNCQSETFEINLNNQFYKQIFSYYDKNLRLLNKTVEYYKVSYRLESKMYAYELRKHRLIEQFQIYVFERDELKARYEEKFSNNLDDFVKNCVVYSKEIKKIQNFINYLLEYFSLDAKVASFLALLLKLGSLKGMYAQIQLVLRLSQRCYLVKIPNFGVLVDRLPVRIKIIIHTLDNKEFLFCFLDSLSQVLDPDLDLIGPKATLDELDKTDNFSKNFSQLTLN